MEEEQQQCHATQALERQAELQNSLVETGLRPENAVAACVDRMSNRSASEHDVEQEGGSWIDAKNIMSNLDDYVKTFCGGFNVDTARRLVECGKDLLERILFGNDTLSGLPVDVGSDPQRATSTVIWALMDKALQRGESFQQGTFVIYGPRAERILNTLLPHLKGRRSSHFKCRTVAPAAEYLPHEASGCTHFGINVDPDGSKDLPANHRHVVLGLIRMYDGSQGVYLKPERHGCDTSSLENLGETFQHGCDYAVSQMHRTLGDQREHDEGMFKRKEYIPMEDVKWYEETLEALKTIRRDEIPPVSDLDFGLGQMAKAVDQILDSLKGMQANLMDKRKHWDELHGPSLHLRTGREVLLHTKEWQRTDIGEWV